MSANKLSLLVVEPWSESAQYTALNLAIVTVGTQQILCVVFIYVNHWKRYCDAIC